MRGFFVLRTCASIHRLEDQVQSNPCRSSCCRMRAGHRQAVDDPDVTCLLSLLRLTLVAVFGLPPTRDAFLAEVLVDLLAGHAVVDHAVV